MRRCIHGRTEKQSCTACNLQNELDTIHSSKDNLRAALQALLADIPKIRSAVDPTRLTSVRNAKRLLK